MHTTTLLSSMHLPPCKTQFFDSIKRTFRLGEIRLRIKERKRTRVVPNAIYRVSLSPFVAGNGKIAQLIFLVAHFGFFVKLVARDASGGAEQAVFI